MAQSLVLRRCDLAFWLIRCMASAPPAALHASYRETRRHLLNLMASKPIRYDHTIEVSLTAAECDRLTRLARHAGLSRSSFVRAAVADLKVELVLKQAFIGALLELIRRMDSNGRPDLAALLREVLEEAKQDEV